MALKALVDVARSIEVSERCIKAVRKENEGSGTINVVVAHVKDGKDKGKSFEVRKTGGNNKGLSIIDVGLMTI